MRIEQVHEDNAFVEHLMGQPEGWVTNLSLPRTGQLRALGNGVVPHQAAHAGSLLLDDLTDLLAITAPAGRTARRQPTGREADVA